MSPLPAPEPRPERFEGHDGRDCGEHRTTGPRAWCFNCQEWCYPGILCRGCELPLLRARAEQAEAGVAALRERLAHVRLQRDGWQQRAEQARLAAEDLLAHVGPSHVVTPYVLRVLHALDQPEETR